MPILRHLRSAPVPLLALLFAAVLAMRVLIPGGYMLAERDGAMWIVPCPGAAAAAPPAMAMPMHDTMAGMHHAPIAPEPAGDHAKPAMPCAFAALAAPVLAAVDPVLLAIALAVGQAMLRRAVPPLPARARPHLRPPSHGPPAAMFAR